MPSNRTFQTSFTGGEFDQKLRDRTDIRKFFEASQKMRNFVLLAQGGFTRRPGSLLLQSTGKTGRLIPFLYSSQDGLLVFLSNLEYTVYDLAGNLLQTSSWIFKEDELSDVTYVQRGNAIIFCHRKHPPSVITRNPEDDTFTGTSVTYGSDGNGISQQPFSKKNRGNQILFTVANLNEGGASVGLTSNEDYFTAAHVGSLIRIEEGYAEITSYTGPRSVTIRQDIAPKRVTNYEALSTTENSTAISISLPEHKFAVGQVIELANYFGFNGLSNSDINGTRTVIAVYDKNSFAIQASNPANASGPGGGFVGDIKFTGPSPILREQSFSPVNGYPNAVAVHEQRLWFGGTEGEPDNLWGSNVGEFDNFDVGRAEPSDSIQIRIDDGTVNEIRHLVSSRHLQILTNENEYYAPSSEQNPLTPATFVVRKQTPYGSSRVRATLFDGATIFLQDSGRSVREFLYTDREFAYNARNIALLSQHLIEQPVQMDAIYGGLQRPEQYVFLVNSTGTVSVLHSIRNEEVVGWVQWETQGNVISLCVVGERVFWIRLHESGDYYLEEVDFTFNYFMDGIIGFQSETPTTEWGPALEYANQEVAVTADGYFLGYTTLDENGNFKTDYDFTSCEIGHNFVAIAETMQAAFSLPDGPTTGLPLRLTRAVVDFGESNEILVDGQRLIIRQTEDQNPQNNPDPFDKKEEFWLNIISREPSVQFVSEVPLPCSIYSCMLEIAF